MVCDFAHVGFTAEIPLPSQGFPARFLAQPQHATRDVRFRRILGAPGIFGTIIIASQSTEVCP